MITWQPHAGWCCTIILTLTVPKFQPTAQAWKCVSMNQELWWSTLIRYEYDYDFDYEYDTKLISIFVVSLVIYVPKQTNMIIGCLLTEFIQDLTQEHHNHNPQHFFWFWFIQAVLWPAIVLIFNTALWNMWRIKQMKRPSLLLSLLWESLSVDQNFMPVKS